MFSPIVHPPEIIRHFFKKYTWKLTPEDSSQKVLYITIDDGPIPEMTPGTLDILKKYDAKATFFCVGENVEKYPDIFQRIIMEGHSIGNHTFNHLNGLRTKNSVYLENVQKADALINSNLFRPPHGRMKSRQSTILSKDRKIILWDILSKDYDKRISKERCWQNVYEYVIPGAVHVFHANLKAFENQRYALEKTLERFTLSGYEFKAIGYKKLNEI